MQTALKHTPLLKATLLGLTTLSALGLVAALPQAARAQVTHVSSGTSLSGFSGSTKGGQYIRFDLTSAAPGGAATISAANIVYSGPWKVTLSDLFGATYSPGVGITPNYSDPKSSTVTIPVLQSDNFFQLPVTTFGDGFSFDLTLNGAVSTPFDYTIFAQDDPVEIADLHYAPGSSTPTLIYAAPGASVTGNIAAAPEPSQTAAFGLGMLGLAGLLLRAKKRRPVA